MRIFVEVRLDKKKQLPSGAASALAVELNKRLQRRFTDIEATVRMAGMDGLSVRNGTPADRETIEEVMQETWESADDWFQP
ncbi:DNA-damage-inducible protein I [Serratia ficaria]|uniref:DinI-like family protein n=1 Tax=Serratia ficaria TaxID=61651 RepID=UPI0021778779|nr:DinI-like family protein [Serratia ficaria]CAI1041588.1 DNA-damage-inducible protein I [Serratia ficaria]CAI1788712.1 DNA-damage-inducible protein I [Serratia ficaria]CAI2420760.1 DNA-damage-inducible protein I [Serratia ficaria]CAI2498139.1 DNA-damage-inducible protein I [Serratia ficaria]CAI2792084.1 DNA-damage-inducible protein I [Serratia ficaria]